MSKTWHYSADRKQIILDELPKKKKKITGHRFPAILGIDRYNSPFSAWCEITGLATLPFEDNKYTIAGKTVEPKMIEYARQKFPNIMSMEEYYGNNIDEYRYSNYKDLGRIFDGVRDFVSVKNNGRDIVMVGECKTSSAPQQWVGDNVPLSYLAQGMLYAYLDKLDRILFVASFLNPMDYNHPENYKVSDANTKFTVKKLNECYLPLPNGDMGTIELAIEYCEQWWSDFIEKGISPPFDEIKDKPYLDIIRKSQPSNDNELEDVCDSAIALVKEIELLKISSGIKAKEKELKLLEADIKSKMMEKELHTCGAYTLSAKNDKKFNEKEFAKEQPTLYNKYTEDVVTYKLTKKVEEEK